MRKGTKPDTAPSPSAWWQAGAIYQIYPRFFQDSNGDGIGDLAGIAARLDYLVELGVDAVWISPVYPSPMADFGYDVSDYCGIDPRFGAWFKKCHFQVTPEIDRALMVKGFLVLGVTLI